MKDQEATIKRRLRKFTTYQFMNVVLNEVNNEIIKTQVRNQPIFTKRKFRKRMGA